jgi:excisionase family DNA binding protein
MAAQEKALDLLTITVAAARLGCSDMHVYRLIAAGALGAVDIAQPGARRSKTRVRSDEVDAYIEARTRRVRPAAADRPRARGLTGDPSSRAADEGADSPPAA